MNANQVDIELILNTAGGVISRRQHPQLVASIDWLVKAGQLARILPGIYCRAEDASNLGVRLRAAAAGEPGAVVLGRAAAYLGFWEDLKVEGITLATNRRITSQKGFTVVRRMVQPDFVRDRGPLRFTCPALTALDLVAEMHSGEPIDVALRTQAASLEEMNLAFAALRYRKGNPVRATMLLDSRDEPWSEAERPELSSRPIANARIGWSWTAGSYSASPGR